MPPALPSKSDLQPRAIALDLFERMFVIAMFCVFAVANLRIFLATDLDIRISMLIVSETLPVLLIVGRPPSPSLSQKPFDWIAGLSGTAFPLLVTGTTQLRPLIPLIACLLLILIGLFVQIAAKICLGRSFGLIAANRGVKSQGPYRFVRHPMYAGYTLTHIGLFLSMPSLRNALLYSLALSFQLVRIVREEAVLRQDAEYRAFAEQVRFRLVPKLF